MANDIDDIFDTSDIVGRNTEPDKSDNSEKSEPYKPSDSEKAESDKPKKKDNVDYEKLSYGRLAYKRVQKLRKKGEWRGIKVPKLKYELHKPDKPRVAFWICAIASAVFFTAIVVIMFGFLNELVKSLSGFNGFGAVLVNLFNPETIKSSFGWSIFPAILGSVLYIMLFVLFLIPISAIVFFYTFIAKEFYLARCSKEEFACSGQIRAILFSTGVAVAVLTALFIAVMVLASKLSIMAMVYLILIYVFLLIVFCGLFVLIILERKKSRKWFAELDMEMRKNYMEHEYALSTIQRRINSEQRMADWL